MGTYVADAAVKKMIETGQAPKKSKVVILGLTFKENCPDCRNSKVADIIGRLGEYGIKPDVVDPWADSEVAKHEYGVDLVKLEDVHDADCVIVAVAHNEFRELRLEKLKDLYRESADAEKVLIDVKGIYSSKVLYESNLSWWRL
jgi:UDP-N-acetyl-D-galactosamine dehydrogenase